VHSFLSYQVIVLKDYSLNAYNLTFVFLCFFVLIEQNRRDE